MIETPVVRQNLLAIEALQKAVERIEAKGKERDELLSTLRRYVKLEERFGFGVDEILTILLKPVGRAGKRIRALTHTGTSSLSGNDDQIIYDSHVTLNNGKEYVFEGVNIKKLIDGGE